MAQVKAATICQAGRIQREIVDCYLNGTIVPDSFTLMTAANRRLEHTASLQTKSTGCFAVFDGIGNTEAAAGLTHLLAEELKKETGRIALLPLADLEGLIRRLAARIDERMGQIARIDPTQTGSGAGLTCICLRDDRAMIYQIGPGRVYLYRGGQLYPQGAVGLEPAFLPDRATPAAVFVTTGPIRLEEQDRLLICSENLPEIIQKERIHQGLDIDDPYRAAAQLVGLAQKIDDRENITATVISFSDAVARPRSSQPIAGNRQSRMSVPQPHFDHEAKILKVPEKKKAAVGKFKLTHFLFWEAIPAWLQLWSLIALIALLLLLFWLIGPKIFG